MATTFQNPVDAFAAIDDRLKARIQEDDVLAVNMAQLSDEDLAEVRARWTEEQAKEMRIETRRETRRWTEPQIVGGGGVMRRTGPSIAREKEVVHTRPLYDRATETFLTQWKEDPEIFDWQSASQQEVEGALALLTEAYPDKTSELLPLARARAKKILEERGQLIPGEDEDARALLANELARRTAAAGGAAGGSTIIDLAQRMVANPLPVSVAGAGRVADVDRSPEATKAREVAAAEGMNRLTGLSEENRRLFRLAYDHDTALTEMLSTGAAWMGGANALFRRSLGAVMVPKIDPKTGLRVVSRSGRPRMVEAPLRVDPLSRRGLAEGLAYDTAVGAALGPEYAPSFIAETLGMEPGRLSSAIESGATGLLLGTALRQLSNAQVLRQAREMPQFADVRNASAAEFRKVFRERMPEIFEEMRRAAAQRAGGRRPEAGGAEGGRASETASMGGEFLDDMPATAVRRPEGGVSEAGGAETAGRLALPEGPGEPTAIAGRQSLLPPAGPRQQGADPATGNAGEAARTAGEVQSAPQTPKVKKGKRPSLGLAPDGSLDLLTVIEELGGVRSPRGLKNAGGEYDGFDETFNQGPLRNLVRRNRGSRVDQLIEELREFGYRFDSADEFYAAADKAWRAREAMRQQIKFEEDRGLFYRVALDNKGGRRIRQKPSATEITPVDELAVGDRFKIKGEPVVVRDVDPDTGAVVVDDGPRFGDNLELPPGEVVFPDKGSFKKAVPDDDWPEPEPAAARGERLDLERATPEQLEREKQMLADRAARQKQQEEIERRQLEPLTGDSSEVGQGKLFAEDEDLFSGASAQTRAGGGSRADMGDAPGAEGFVGTPAAPPRPPEGPGRAPEEVESLILEMPELVQLAKALLRGRFPRVLERLRAGRGLARGMFRPGTPGDIELRADIFNLVQPDERAKIRQEALQEARELVRRGELKPQEAERYAEELAAQRIDDLTKERLRTNPEQAQKTLAHEIGHLVDHLPDHLISNRGNLLGRLASLKGHLKHTMPRDPAREAGAPLTPKDRARLRREAERQMREEVGPMQEIVRTILVEEPEWRLTGIRAEDVRDLFGMHGREKFPELYEWFARQPDQVKKQIVKAAMRGVVDERLAHLARREQTGTRVVEKTVRQTVGREPTKAEIQQRFRELLRQEIEKRNLLELKTVRDELMGASEWWRGPMGEPGTAYYKYRAAGEELYADAFSMLVNNPAELRARAPVWWEVFHAYLDKKKEVRDLWRGLQDDIKSGRIYKQRVENLRESFQRADDRGLTEEALAEKPLQEKLDDWRLFFDRQFGPIYRRMEQAAKRDKKAGRGKKFSPIEYEGAIREFIYRTTKHEAFLRRVNLEVLAPLVEQNLDWVDLAEVMFHSRVVQERFDIANPLGWTPKASLERLEEMERTLGEQRWQALTDARAAYRTVYEEEVLKRLREMEIFDKETLDLLDERVAYATFRVEPEAAAHLDPNTIEGALAGRYGAEVAARIYRQVGTLQDIRNPATATAQKAMSLLSMAYRERAKRAVVQAMNAIDDPMIQPAEWRWTGRRREPVIVENDRVGTLVFVHKGKVQAWYVPRAIAGMFENATDWPMGAVLGTLYGINNVMKGIFAPLNYGFWLVGHWRDIRGWERRMPGNWREKNPLRGIPFGRFVPLGDKRFSKYYLSSFLAARASVRGKPNKLADEALRRGMVISRAEQRGRRRVTDDSIERQLSRFGMKPASWKREDVALIDRLLEAWHSYAATPQIFERTTKIAAMQMLDEHYPKMPEAEKMRYVHQWGGSPDFLEKGRGSPMMDMLMLFYNPWKQSKRAEWRAWKRDPMGMLASLLALTAPTTILLWMLERGYLTDGLEAIMGRENAEDYQEMLRSIPEQDKARFHVVPLGWANKEHKQAIYLALHLEEEERLQNAAMRAALNLDEQGAESLRGGAAYAGGELPGANPLLKVGKAWFEYAMLGRNPYDSFYGREIVDADEFEAGQGTGDMLEWTWNSVSGNLFGRMGEESIYDPDTTKLQEFLKAPVVSNTLGRWLRVSNRGLYEEADRITGDVREHRAELRVIGQEIMRKIDAGEEFTGSEKELLIEEPYLMEYLLRRLPEVMVQKGSVEMRLLQRAGSTEERMELLKAWAERDQARETSGAEAR